MNTESNNPYYPDLWDNPSSAPTWRKELVWDRIHAHNKATTGRYSWRNWGYWFLLILLIMVPRLPENISNVDPKPIRSQPIRNTPANPPKPEVELIPQAPSQKDIPNAIDRPFQEPVALLPARIPKEGLSSDPFRILPKDKVVPQLARRSPGQLISEPNVKLYPSGTKISMKVPELMELPPEPDGYWVRVFRQFRNINTNGKIDWKDLNIIPDEHGGFVIFYYPSTPPTPQNN